MAVTYAQVGVSLGRAITNPLEQAQITQWIADVLLIIEAKLGSEAVAAIDVATLDYVTREAVAARVLNPENKQSEQIDDYKFTRFGNARVAGWVTDEWWDMLTPDVQSSAFTIRPGGDPGYRTDSLTDLDWS